MWKRVSSAVQFKGRVFIPEGIFFSVHPIKYSVHPIKYTPFKHIIKSICPGLKQILDVTYARNAMFILNSSENAWVQAQLSTQHEQLKCTSIQKQKSVLLSDMRIYFLSMYIKNGWKRIKSSVNIRFKTNLPFQRRMFD